MKGQDFGDRWMAPVAPEENRHRKVSSKKIFAQGVMLGALLAVIAGIAFIALSNIGTNLHPDAQTTASLPDRAPAEARQGTPEIVPGLSRLAERAAGPAPAEPAPTQPTAPPTAPPAAADLPMPTALTTVPLAPEPAAPGVLPVREPPLEPLLAPMDAVPEPAAPSLAAGTPAPAVPDPGVVAPPADDIATGDERAAPVAPPMPVARATPITAEKPAEIPIVAPAPPGRPAAERNVARMQLAARMQGLEPGAPVTLPIRLERGEGRTIYFFTELKGLAGRSIVHRWHWNGRAVLDRPVRPGSSSWRAYTAKAVDKPGSWRVAVVDTDSGAVLAEEKFEVK